MDLVIHKQEHLQMHWYNKLRDGLIYVFMIFSYNLEQNVHS